MYLVSGNLDLKSQVMRKPALSVGGQEIEINVSFQKGCKNLSTSDLLQPGLCQTGSEITKTGFFVTWL